jgi:hypothetical protein
MAEHRKNSESITDIVKFSPSDVVASGAENIPSTKNDICGD